MKKEDKKVEYFLLYVLLGKIVLVMLICFFKIFV